MLQPVTLLIINALHKTTIGIGVEVVAFVSENFRKFRRKGPKVMFCNLTFACYNCYKCSFFLLKVKTVKGLIM